MYTLTTLDNPSFIAVEPTTFAAAKTVYNAVNNPTMTIDDVINKEICIVNIAMRSEEKNRDDGTTYVKTITTLLLDTGESVECTYTRFAKSCIQLLNTFGSPDTWEQPIKVIPRRKSFGGNFHDTVILDLA